MMRPVARLVLPAASALFACAIAGSAAAQGTIVGSKHDLSSSSSGLWGSYDEDEVCVFCHTPHQASPQAPLWNRASRSASYALYSSQTLQATVEQPGTQSLLCLSCHDGVTALNAVLNPSPTAPAMDPGGDQIGDIYYPGSPYGMAMNIGGSYPGNPGANNLADDHPSSFVFNSTLVSQDGELRLPPADDAVQLWGPGQDRVECTSCHDVHDPTYRPFLVKDNARSALCLTCHVK